MEKFFEIFENFLKNFFLKFLKKIFVFSTILDNIFALAGFGIAFEAMTTKYGIIKNVNGRVKKCDGDRMKFSRFFGKRKRKKNFSG